jgi:flavin reductase (DIM6/NTAB) family NADH-FMN oxidoreductase RutF
VTAEIKQEESGVRDCGVVRVQTVPQRSRVMQATVQRTIAPAPAWQKQLRNALGQYATGVAVVTTHTPGGLPVGMTINSFGPLSLDPPLIMWCLRRSASRGAVFAAADHFAINVLAAGQGHLAQQFAMRNHGEFAGTGWYQGPRGLPLLRGALGAFTCRRAEQLDGGDHVIVVGHLENYAITAGPPLVFHGGRYHTLRAVEPA